MVKLTVPKIFNVFLGVCFLLRALPGYATDFLPFEHRLEEQIWTENSDKLQDLEGPAARLIQLEPKSAYAHYLLAQLYLRQFKSNPTQLKLLKQASELGQQAMELSPDRDFGYLIAAQVLDLMGYTKSSQDVLASDGRSLDFSTWRVPFVQGLLQSGQGWDLTPTSHFEASLKMRDAQPNVVIPEVIKALHVSYSGEQLVDELKNWNRLYTNESLALRLGEAYTQVGKFAEAHRVYEELKHRHPAADEAFVLDAIVLSTHLDQAKAAEKIFQDLLEGKPKISEVRRPTVQAHLARLKLEKGDVKDSEQLFFDAIAQGDQSMEWLTFAHKTYEGAQRLREFTKLLDRLSSKIPGSGYLFALQGEILSENLAMHDRALESFESAILLDPSRTEFLNGLGLTYYRMSRYDDALSSFLRATRVDPQDATSRYNQACVLSIMGRATEALGSLREAIGLDPRLQQTARNDKDFANLREIPSFRLLTEPRSSASIRNP